MHLMPASGPINLLTREFEINENKETIVLVFVEVDMKLILFIY
jgi:hypothetical protein